MKKGTVAQLIFWFIAYLICIHGFNLDFISYTVGGSIALAGVVVKEFFNYNKGS